MEGPNYRTQNDEHSNYEVDGGRRESKRTRRARRPEHSHGNRPIVVNGIHRRRNKRWTW